MNTPAFTADDDDDVTDASKSAAAKLAAYSDIEKDLGSILQSYIFAEKFLDKLFP
jgi:hypothetical protein